MYESEVEDMENAAQYERELRESDLSDGAGSCSSESSSSFPRGFEDLKKRGRASLFSSLNTLLGFNKKRRRMQVKKERLKRWKQKHRKARRERKAAEASLGEISSSGSEEDLETRVLNRMKKKQNCNICYHSQELLESRCKHKACRGCWDSWLKVKNQCPFCKESVTEEELAKAK